MADHDNAIQGLLKGLPVSEGVAIGRAWLVQSPWDKVVSLEITSDKVADETGRFREALQDVAVQLADCRAVVSKEVGGEEAKIFESHLAILNDPLFQEDIPGFIVKNKKNAEFALKENLDHVRLIFSKMENEFFKHRIDDIQDVATRLLRVLQQSEGVRIEFDEPTVMIAHHLTPSDTAKINYNNILGFATELGGPTSHVSILARSMGLPGVVGIEKLVQQVRQSQMVIIDGNTGIVYLDPPERALKSYQRQQKEFVTYWKKLNKDTDLPSTTQCGKKIRLHANVSMTSDISMAVRYHAAGIGLYRTEIPFLIHGKMLSQDEQFKIYRTVVESFPGKTVTIRTLDIGGDKFMPFQDIASEQNPFLGWRSIRIFLQEKDLFKAQLKAILRASHYGKVHILFPMISSREEISAINLLLNECKHDLTEAQIPFDEAVKIGIMIEVPSAAICADQLLKHCDFLSIGTNDLIQYTLAVDRNNKKVSRFFQPLNPAILRLILATVQAGLKWNKPISMCGEMAGNPLYTGLLIGLGLRHLSMTPVMIPELKERVRALEVAACEELAKNALDLDSGPEIEKLLADFNKNVNPRQGVPLLKTTKEIKAIKVKDKS